MKKIVAGFITFVLLACVGMATYYFIKIKKLVPYSAQAQSEKLEDRLKKVSLQAGSPIFIRIFKASSELEVWIQGRGDIYHHFKTYPICAFSGKLGPKLKEGDRQAPEGFYTVTRSQMNPNSTYHLSFNLGYPNAFDRAHGRTGSYLMVHGNCVSIGCYAMTDAGIEEIYFLADKAHKAGQKKFSVHAFPFRMTAKNMRKYKDSKWHPFWLNLKKGFDYFESKKQVPRVRVKTKTYIVE